MTSSLVGSEMCIRDRVPPRRAEHRGAIAHVRRGRRAAVVSAGGAAVSYTHLTLPTICSV
eukprot:9847735-Prorocentrum_lima.AAC.1